MVADDMQKLQQEIIMTNSFQSYSLRIEKKLSYVVSHRLVFDIYVHCVHNFFYRFRCSLFKTV